jgi:hypothetical protein
MNEEALIYIAMVVIGTPVALVAITRGGAIGAGETLAGCLALLGAAGIVRTIRNRPKLPKARARKRSSDTQPPSR